MISLRTHRKISWVASLALLTCACGETTSTPNNGSVAGGGAGGAAGGAIVLPTPPTSGGTGGTLPTPTEPPPAEGGAPAGGAPSGGSPAGGASSGGSGGDGISGGAGGETYTENPGTEGDGDHVAGPDYPIDPDLTDLGKPKGRMFEFDMRLADSVIFNGKDTTIDPALYTRELRRIRVYVPAAYKDGTKAPILIVMDGDGLGERPCFNVGCKMDLITNALDNLTVSTDPARQLPAFIAISVQNGGGNGPGSERGLEYDTVSDRFARFIQEEVLPAVLANADLKAAYPNIAFTDNPWGRGAIGCSSGASAALVMGWFRPDLFRRIVSYSGSFTDIQDRAAPEEVQYPLGAWEFHDGQKLIENSDVKPLRVFLQVADGDQQLGEFKDWKLANQQMAAAMKAKGYAYRYVYTENAGHCTNSIFDLTMADTLVWMWRGYHQE